MFPTPPVHEEEPRDKCPGCVAMYDCDSHRRAREEARDIAAAQWAKVAPLIEALREAAGVEETIDAARAIIAATEPTP